MARRRKRGRKRRLNPSDRELLYASAAGSIALGTLGYVVTHRAWPVVAGVVIGMVATPLLLGAKPKQMKKILLSGGIK